MSIRTDSLCSVKADPVEVASMAFSMLKCRLPDRAMISLVGPRIIFTRFSTGSELVDLNPDPISEPDWIAVVAYELNAAEHPIKMYERDTAPMVAAEKLIIAWNSRNGPSDEQLSVAMGAAFDGEADRIMQDVAV